MLPGRTYTVTEVLYLLNRYKWLIVLPWISVSLGTVLVARMLPDHFRSESLIQVVPQRVPTEFVRSTITAGIGERLPAIQQQILSRTRLERIIQDFGLYAKERKTALMEDIVRDMRAAISVSMIKGDAFQVSYTSNEARTAMKVTERLASLFVEENLRDREVLAEGANQFLDSQLDESLRRLLDKEKKLEQYRIAHAGELPSQLQGNIQTMASIQSTLQQLAESINRDKDRRLVLERVQADLNTTPDQGGGERGQAATQDTDSEGNTTVPARSAVAQLEMARLQLQAMMLRLKPEHPDAARARRVIAELEKKAEAEVLSTPVPVPKGLSQAEAMRQNKLKDIAGEIDGLERQIRQKDEQMKSLQRGVSDVQRRVDVIPTRESEMTALMRDYETLQRIYTTLLSKSEDAKIAANLERRQIGEQFKVIDAARLPERPFSPNRPFINIAGVVAGLVLGIALVGAIEFNDSSFRTDDDVVAVLALPVLAVVPAMLTGLDRRVIRRRNVIAAFAGAVFVLTLGVAVLAWRGGYLSRWI